MDAEQYTTRSREALSAAIRHAEARELPYVGIEVRQDLIAEAEGQAQWAERLSRIANEVALALG